MPRYSNANSFANGAMQGLSFIGGMIDLLEHKENRERKFKREDAAERRLDKRLSFAEHTDARQGDIHGLNMKGKQIQNEAAAYGLDETKAGRGTRDAERKAKGLEAINRATFANTKGQSGAFDPGGIGEQAFNSVFKNQINTADRSALGLEVEQKTKGAKIKGINAKSKLSVSQANVAGKTEGAKIKGLNAKSKIAESQANVQAETEQDQIDLIHAKMQTAQEQYQQLADRVGEDKLFDTEKYGKVTLKELSGLYANEMKALGEITTIRGGSDPRIKDFDTWLADKLKKPPLPEGENTINPGKPHKKPKKRLNLNNYLSSGGVS